MAMKLYAHQSDALNRTQNKNHVAYYHDMGLGKTFTGAEKMWQLSTKKNLVVCQKSKIGDWYDHLLRYSWFVYDLTDPKDFNKFISVDFDTPFVGVINYDLIFRRKELQSLTDFTLLLDESSLIQNVKAKRTKFIMKMQPKNVILLSGTPTGGKYENLLTQMNLLGWKISEQTFWNQYVDWEWQEIDGFWQKKVLGYKNEERMKRKMREHGCDFLKTEDVLDLPDQIDQKIYIDSTKQYKSFRKNEYLEIDDKELIGDTTLKKMLYERQLCGQYNDDKFVAYQDLLRSTDDRFIVFYNFNDELSELMNLTDGVDRPISIVNGQEKELNCYDEYSNSVILVQYQAGAMGLNLQKANRVIYFTPPLSSELFEQSKKRIHRIGQNKTCFYYYLVCRGSIEEKIYRTLAKRKDYTDKLFEQEENNG